MNTPVEFKILSLFFILFRFSPGETPDNTTYRHNGHSLRDLDTRTCKSRYLSSAQGESFQVYRRADLFSGDDFVVVELDHFGFGLGRLKSHHFIPFLSFFAPFFHVFHITSSGFILTTMRQILVRGFCYMLLTSFSIYNIFGLVDLSKELMLTSYPYKVNILESGEWRVVS